jgi:hypothetical protein
MSAKRTSVALLVATLGAVARVQFSDGETLDHAFAAKPPAQSK